MLSTKKFIFIGAIIIILSAIIKYFDFKFTDWIGKDVFDFYILLIFIAYVGSKTDNLYTRINSLNNEIHDIKNSVDVELFSEFKHKTLERDMEQIQEKISKLECDLEEIKTIVEEEEKEKIKKQKKVSSYICKVYFEIDRDFAYKEMRLAGYDPEKDFDLNESSGSPYFQHIKDFISGLEFVSIGRHY